jgi:hypothetical protein
MSERTFYIIGERFFAFHRKEAGLDFVVGPELVQAAGIDHLP